MSAFGFMNDRKGRRVIQPPGGESQMNILADASTTAPPRPSIRLHQAHNNHMRSQIFDYAPPFPAKEAPRPTSIVSPVQDDCSNGDRRSSVTTAPYYGDRNPESSYDTGRVVSTPRQSFAGSPEISNNEHNDAFAQERSSGFSAEPTSSRNYPATESAQSTPRYRKQTEESVDSMFSRYQQSHSRGSMGNADTDNDLANAGGPRGAAMVNKMRQSNRGFNVLTGQSELEEATANQRYRTEQARTVENEQRVKTVRENRAPAGISPGGARPYIRGQAHDSGPLW